MSVRDKLDAAKAHWTKTAEGQRQLAKAKPELMKGYFTEEQRATMERLARWSIREAQLRGEPAELIAHLEAILKELMEMGT